MSRSAGQQAVADVVPEALEAGIFLFDPASEAYRLSDRCKLMWGFAPEDDPTREMLLRRVHPDDLHLAATARQALTPEGTGSYSIELRLVLPDGSVRRITVSGHASFSDSGGVRRVVRGYGAMRDITELEHASG